MQNAVLAEVEKNGLQIRGLQKISFFVAMWLPDAIYVVNVGSIDIVGRRLALLRFFM
jgi:hypothetical protein